MFKLAGENDIYKIHQSGDLANLDGLDDSALKRLPSLLTLRDSLYSSAFRKYLSSITGSGPLSGKKTDMAVNVYTPGCHLLCHDDVIGSRRVSWILYLLDPDKPWKPEYGGALRLYPTEHKKTADGDEVKVPSPEFSLVIPPAWNQLSFFTVQPGESFHDVEEVYKRGLDEMEQDDGGRVRMAISGWFHIPQEGEEGFEEGLEEKLAEKSSLAQLQGGKADVFDEPQAHWVENPDWEEQAKQDDDDVELTETEIDFLIKYMNPNYLTPDTVEEISELFQNESSLRLAGFLSAKFSARLREYLESKDHEATPSLPSNPHNKDAKVGIALYLSLVLTHLLLISLLLFIIIPKLHSILTTHIPPIPLGTLTNILGKPQHTPISQHNSQIVPRSRLAEQNTIVFIVARALVNSRVRFRFTALAGSGAG